MVVLLYNDRCCVCVDISQTVLGLIHPEWLVFFYVPCVFLRAMLSDVFVADHVDNNFIGETPGSFYECNEGKCVQKMAVSCMRACIRMRACVRVCVHAWVSGV